MNNILMNNIFDKHTTNWVILIKVCLFVRSDKMGHCTESTREQARWNNFDLNDLLRLLSVEFYLFAFVDSHFFICKCFFFIPKKIV